MASQRDALVTRCGEQHLVIAADNSAGIGLARLDQVQVDPYLVGLLTTRVALLEAISLGAEPLGISSTLSFSHQSEAGQLIYQGILTSAATVGLDHRQITGSSETNFPVDLTCLGVTVVAASAQDQLLLDRVNPGDACWLLGRPLLGAEVVAAYRELLPLPLAKVFVRWPTVHEVLPIGSHGIGWELEQLAERYDLRWQAEPLGMNFPWRKSAGPATCLVVCGRPEAGELLINSGQIVTLLGHLHSQ